MSKRVQTISDEEMFGSILADTAEGRRILSNHSHRFFFTYYFKEPMLDHQLRWADRLDRTWRGGIITHPGAGKTRLIGRGFPIREICNNRNVRILIISKNTAQARKRLATIRLELETNEKLIGDFGTFYDRDRKWTENIITVIRDATLEEGTLEAVGLGKGMTGNRVDLIILDDLIDAINCRTSTQREKILDYVKDTILTRLDRGGRVLFIGTRFHPYDLYQYFLDHPFYDVIVEKAITREPKSYKIIRVENPRDYTEVNGTLIPYTVVFTDNDEGECLAPDIKNMTELLLIKREITSSTFNRIFQSEATSDDVANIKSKWLENAKDESLSYGSHDIDKYIVVLEGVDPALVTSRADAEASDSDYTVGIIGGVREDRHIDIIGLHRDRGMTPSEVKQMFIDHATDYEPKLQFIETNAHGEILRWNIKNETGVPIAKHHTTKQKKYDPYTGVTSVAAMFENGQIHLPYRTEDDREITDRLCNELSSVPTEDGHDDQFSALWILIAGTRKYLKHKDQSDVLQAKQRDARQRIAAAQRARA